VNQRAPTEQLNDAEFDVAVIGGGINGVAIARECARGGKRTLLLESHDFAAGTSSRSTRIIHGGLRYLEHGELGLVRESLRERQHLLSLHGHLVRPLSFLLALPAGGTRTRSALAVRFGLWLYRRMAGSLGAAKAHDHLKMFERQLDSDANWMTFDYDDAQCEFPERLIAEWLVQAITAGAVARNHAEVLEIVVHHGRAHGIVFRDRLTGREVSIRARHVVNATGPWVDRMCGRLSVSNRASRMIGGVRGTHLVLSRFDGLTNVAIYAEAEDGRPVFVLPWYGDLLVGTTEVPDNEDPGQVAPTTKEISYLLRSAQRLFPAARIDASMVRHAFAGVRPLPFLPGKSVSAITRRHILHDHSEDGVAGLISIIGGKLTTAAALARQYARKIGIRVDEPMLPLVAPCGMNGMDVTLRHWSQAVSANTGITPESASAIAEWYGPRAFDISLMARMAPELRTPICPHTPHVVAEVVDAVRNECAVTLGDILLRRVPVALPSHWNNICTRHALQAIAPVLGWPHRRAQREAENFETERARFLRRIDASARPEDRLLPAKHAA
jgi:glycerol-3-phosphate dehydrogenase